MCRCRRVRLLYFKNNYMIFGNNTIKKGVMQVIKTRIDAAEKEHVQACASFDENCETQKRAAEELRDNAKKKSAEVQINNILGKLI